MLQSWRDGTLGRCNLSRAEHPHVSLLRKPKLQAVRANSQPSVCRKQVLKEEVTPPLRALSKSSEFPMLNILPCDANSWDPPVSPPVVLRRQEKRTQSHCCSDYCCAVRKSCFSDPAVSCLSPASVNRYEASSLAWKEDRISALSQSLADTHSGKDRQHLQEVNEGKD